MIHYLKIREEFADSILYGDKSLKLGTMIEDIKR